MVSHTKEKSTAALLCLFLGGVGAHRFYVGKPGTALIQAILPVAGLFVLIIAAAVDGGGIGLGLLMMVGGGSWVIIDFIMILAGRFTDADGDFLGTPKGVVDAKPSTALQDARRIEQRILMTAKQQGGMVVPTDIAMRTGISIDEAKRHLEGLLDDGHVEMHLRKDGGLVYTFRDMLTQESRRELDSP